ncbi:MAG: tyrosine/phenylalanine carboxypeptidase domain-containing protein [Patescibacteria group bacterium]
MKLKQLIPTNLQEEKEKFFADFSYNPQFVYENEIDESKLHEYGLPEDTILSIAKEIVSKAYLNRNELDIKMNEGPVISEKEVTDKFLSFLKLHNLEKRYRVVWSSSFITRAAILQDLIKLKSGSEFRRDGLTGLLYHEIGTHALRRVNYEKQPWFKRKKKYGFSNYLPTEEGLAVLHSLLPLRYKSAYSSALRYQAVEYAQTHSFSELWSYLSRYIDNFDTRWMVTFRQKRGVSDTSKPGGFTKDLVYFKGVVEVFQWLNNHNFNLEALYFGKLSYKDVDKALQLNPGFTPLLPSFYEVNKEEYAENMREVGELNNLIY